MRGIVLGVSASPTALVGLRPEPVPVSAIRRPLIFLKYDCEAIQAAMAVALCNFNAAHPELTYAKIGKEIEREAPSIHEYICGGREMPMSCWIKLTAKWPEMEDRPDLPSGRRPRRRSAPSNASCGFLWLKCADVIEESDAQRRS
jgi:hypothetical protein